MRAFFSVGRSRVSVALRLLLVAMLLTVAPSAYAAVASSIVGTGTLQAPTGSTPLCSLDGAVNDLDVCTNDTLIYNIEYVTTGGDASLTIVSTLPTCSAATTPGCPANGIVAIWEVLPPQCNGAGSGISANGLTLTCVRNGPINAGTARILPLVRVLGTSPNGAVITTPVTTVTTPQMPAPIAAVSTSGPVTIKAQPAFDLVKAPQNQPAGVMQWAKGPDGVTDGWVMVFAAGVRVPGGARGIETLDANGISWQDVVGNITVTAANSIAAPHAAAVQAALRANAVLLPVPTPGGPDACIDNASDWSVVRYTTGMPSGRGGPTVKALQTSGTCSVVQAGPGADVSGRITAALWNNTFYPSLSNDLIPLPAGDNFVSAKEIALWIPASVISILPSNAMIRITNSYSDVRGTSISGQPVAQPNTANDVASIAFTQLLGIGVSKYWSNYNSDNDLRVSGNHTQDGIVVDGMPAMSAVHVSISSLPVPDLVSCDKFDNSKYQIFGNATFGGTYAATPPLQASQYVIEYGTGGIGGAGPGWANLNDYSWANCADDQSPGWYVNRATVPGGDAAITKVRVRVLVSLQPGTTYSLRAPVRVSATSPVAAMGVPSGHVWPIGTRLNNWSVTSFAGANSTTWSSSANNVDSTGQGWLVGGTAGNAYTSAGLTSTARGDTITLVGARAEVSKETSTPANNATQALGGQPITYVIRPVLTSAIATPLTSDMTIKDVLPPGLAYVAGSASLAPDSVQFNTPSTGYTTLNWSLSNVAVGSPITPISFQALVDNTLSNGHYIPNFTVVSSPLDTRQCQASGGAYDGILNTGYAVNSTNGNVTGALCVHANRRDLRVSNPGGFQVNKTAVTPLTEPGQTVSYALSWISVGNDLNTSDLIDILPFSGDSRGSSFSGTVQLTGALGPVAGDGAPASVIYYTARVPASISADPNHASNVLPGGSTGWCTAGQFGSGGCPASFPAVTAFRVVSSALQQAGIQRALTVPIATSGNATGDLYRNNFVIRGTAGGVPLAAAVTSPTAQAEVTSSSIGGRVFRDDDDDGVLNGTDAGLGGVDVTLEGCSSGLDGIAQTTTVGLTGVVACSGDDVPVAVTLQSAADGTYSFADVLSGRYRLIEAQPAGYNDGKRNVGSVGGSANAQGTVPSAIAEIVLPMGTAATDYDFAELVPNPRLTLIKTITNDDGGTADIGDFTLTAAGPVTVTGATGDAAITDVTVDPGTYALSEANLPGYVAGDYACVLNGAAPVSGNSVTLAEGDVAICTIANDDQARPTLTISKVTLGGTGAFDFSGDNGFADETITTTTDGTAQAGTSQTLAAGATATTITETPATGYTLTDIACTGLGTGGTATPDLGAGTVTLDAAATAYEAEIACTFTNTRQVRTLMLQKSWVNAVVGDTSTVTASRGAAGIDSLASTADAATETDADATPVNVAVGETVTLAEALGAGNQTSYAQALACDAADTDLTDGLTIDAADGDITCTFTNTRVNIATFKTSDPVSGTMVRRGDTITYTVTASVAGGPLSQPLTLTDTLGDGLTFGALMPPATGSCTTDQTVICTLPAGTPDGVHTFTYTATVDADAAPGTVGNVVVPSDGICDDPATPGTGPDDCDTNHPVAPTLTIAKVTVGGTGSFDFTGDNGVAAQTIATTVDGTPAVGAVQTLSAIGSATTVGETLPAPGGFVLSGIACDGLGAGGTATPDLAAGTVTLDAAAVAEGASITCTFTNTLRPTLTIAKVSVGGTGSFDFSGDNGIASQTIATTAAGTAVSGLPQLLTAGDTATTITEAPAAGYVLTDVACTGLGAGGTATPDLAAGTVTLDAAATQSGSDIACTFTNTTRPTITIAKVSVGGTGSFDFSGDNGVAAQTITTAVAGTPVSGAPQVLAAGGIATTITEAPAAGFALTDVACTGLGRGGRATPDLDAGRVVLDAAATANGSNITCTFTNSARPTITIAKISIGGTATFAFSGDNGIAAERITTRTSGVAVNGRPQTVADADAVTTIRETPQNGFTLTSVVCAGLGEGGTATPDLEGGTVRLDAAAMAYGAEIVCTFTNAAPAKVTIFKKAGLRQIQRGFKAPFTIVVTNETVVPVSDLDIADLLPSGFRYVAGSAVVRSFATQSGGEGRVVEVKPVIEGRRVFFRDLDLAPNGRIEIRLSMLALSSAGPGEHCNRADVLDPAGEAMAPQAKACVEILAEPVFDCAELIGKVFDDVNRNGYQDEGEPGLPGVRVVTVKGLLITTDPYGRFHVACAELPDQRIGTNFIMKLDTRTLPSGYRMTTENPRAVRLTAGKMSKLNFGAAIGRVVRLDLSDEAFAADGTELKREWEAGLDDLIAVLRKEQSVLRLSYVDQGAEHELALKRLAAIQAEIERRWGEKSGQYRLDIETRVETGE